MGLGPGSYTGYVCLLEVYSYYCKISQASTSGAGWSRSHSSSQACTKSTKMFNRPQSTSGHSVSLCGTILTLKGASSSLKTTIRRSLYASSPRVYLSLSLSLQTESDFAEIAGAGLNWVRLPVPYWAIETFDSEPYFERTAWTYVLKALKWARKYGLRVFLELHTAPGSQNGLNHSGRLNPINWLNGPMGVANAQRTLEHIRVLTEFVSQPEYEPVVTMFGPINEPLMGIIGRDVLDSLYAF